MKIKKKAVEAIQPKKKTQEEELVAFVNDAIQKADEYRRKFKTRWDVIEEQVRCVHPSDWSKKEDWQTKIFIPQQSKTAETAQAYLDKMLFGSKRFFSIQGVEKRDRELEQGIEELFQNVFDRGDFAIENDFVMNETCSNSGTSFLKVTVNPQRTGLTFTWRSVHNILIDPKCGTRLNRAGYIVDQYKKSLQELIEEVKLGKSIYKQDAVEKLIEDSKNQPVTKADESMTVVKAFDGTDIAIPSKFAEVSIDEYWGKVKKSFKASDSTLEGQRMEDRLVTVANGRVILRDDQNDYGFIPIFACRVKPRKYDFYALGFLDNTVDLQELTNSMVNLGFDSLKMCSMDIAMVDATKIKEPSSIEYKPMATWLLKGDPRAAVQLTRQGISALSEIMRGLGLLDQFQQEATGVLRQIQGAPQLSGGGSETLGEYQAKLAMIDNRFLKIARFIERDYIEPLLAGVFKILFNPKFFNQPLIDRILGFKEVKTMVANPMTGEPTEIITRESKLNFNQVASAGEMGFDFKPTGMTQFTKSLETLNKLRELLVEAGRNPQIQLLVNIEEILKRTLQAAEIPDYEDLMKTDEEIKKIMSQIYGGTQGAQQPQLGAPPFNGAPSAVPPQPLGAM